MTGADRELASPGPTGDLNRAVAYASQTAQLCQVSEEILDQWSHEPGFLVIRHNGGQVVRIHRSALERWLEEYALGRNPRPFYSDEPPTAPVRRRVLR